MIIKCVLVLTLVGVMLACGPKLPPNTSVEAKTAVRATQVIAGLRATLPVLKASTCQPTVPKPCVQPADALKIVDNIEKAANVGLELGQVLTLLDNATLEPDKVDLQQKARLILTVLQGILTNSALLPLEPEARALVANMFTNVTALLFAVFGG